MTKYEISFIICVISFKIKNNIPLKNNKQQYKIFTKLTNQYYPY
jgi:hypothetical protein